MGDGQREIDIKKYAKIEKIAGGAIEESRWAACSDGQRKPLGFLRFLAGGLDCIEGELMRSEGSSYVMDSEAVPGNVAGLSSASASGALAAALTASMRFKTYLELFAPGHRKAKSQGGMQLPYGSASPCQQAPEQSASCKVTFPPTLHDACCCSKTAPTLLRSY